MRNRYFTASVVVATLSLAFSAGYAQTKASSGGTAGAAKSAVPDLSGNWGPSSTHRGGGTFSISDPGGLKVGTAEDDTPYQPATLARLKSEKPHIGPDATFDTDDPRIKYCDPIGIPRVYLVPNLFKFVQTPEAVYVLYEYGTLGRQVALNREHPKDPDPTWWGDSTGKYEGDTLVIDTVGFNDKTWLDHAGRPHSDELHLVERFRRLDHDNLELDVTFDDPKAYTKTWTGRRYFSLARRDFIEHTCSMSENEHFRQLVMDPTLTKSTGK